MTGTERAEYLDGDGYPTEAAIEKIENWSWQDWCGLMEFVEMLWYWPDDFQGSREARTYTLATGGWSGNEDLVGALQRNLAFWGACWLSSHRGGRHCFAIPALATPASARKRR